MEALDTQQVYLVHPYNTLAVEAVVVAALATAVTVRATGTQLTSVAVGTVIQKVMQGVLSVQNTVLLA